jgi:hypothetical protein
MVLNIHRRGRSSEAVQRQRRTPGVRHTRRRRGTFVAVLVSTAIAALSLSAVPVEAAVTGGQSIEVFTGSNLISLTGYPATTDVRVEVLRQGFVIGSATKTTDAAGVIEMNHIGAEANDCFDPPSSPDVGPGDTIRTTVLPAGTNVDTSVVRGVFIDDIVFGATTITVSGRVSLTGPARVVPGADVLELRINKDTPWDVNDRPGRRDRREDIGASVAPNGTWTHVLNASAADVAEAQAASETFLEWSAAAGETEEFPSELTVAEFGPGEALPGCPPLQQGPTPPQLATTQDSGQRGDHITNRSANLTFSGLTMEAGPNATVRLLVDGTQRAEATANAQGVYQFTGITLAPRAQPYAVVARAQGTSASFDSAARRVTVDQSRPTVVARTVRPNPFHLTGSERVHAVYRIGEAAQLRARIQRRTPVRTVLTFANRRLTRAGLAEYNWNGKNEINRDVRPGGYRLELTVTDRAGNRTTHRTPFQVVR